MRGRKQQRTYLRYVVLVSFFVIAFLWLGAYLHFIVESRKNSELRAKEKQLSLQAEELLKEVETLRRKVR